MNVSDLIDPSFSYRLIATLMHFLWQGCLVALLAVLGDGLLSRASASRRYALHVAALAIMVACVAITFSRIEAPVSAPVESMAMTSVIEPIAPGHLDIDSDSTPPTATSVFVGVEPPLPEPVPVVAVEAVESPVVIPERSAGDSDRWRQLQGWAPQIALLYFACCGLLLARLIRGTWVAHRLRRMSTTVSDDSLIATLQRQAQELGLRVLPRIAWCAEVSVPLVIGVLKPMILLPAAAATGLSPDQLQALITHELAHIRRYDLLVNLAQRVVESMLFFHPAVWFISRRISNEREQACDELVLATGCERLRYADALVRMAELSSSLRRLRTSAPATSLAATGANSSEFKRRVLKVLSVPTNSQLRPSRIALLVIVALIIGVTVSASRLRLNVFAETQPQNIEDSPSAGRGSPDPALDPTAGLPNSDEETNPTNNANGDLRSNPAAGSGDMSQAQLAPKERPIQESKSKESEVAFVQVTPTPDDEQRLVDELRRALPEDWVVERRFGGYWIDRRRRVFGKHFRETPDVMLHFAKELDVPETPPMEGEVSSESLGPCRFGYCMAAIREDFRSEWPTIRQRIQSVLPMANPATTKSGDDTPTGIAVAGRLLFEDGRPVVGALVGPMFRKKSPLGDDGRFKLRVAPEWSRFRIHLLDANGWPSPRQLPRKAEHKGEVLDVMLPRTEEPFAICNLRLDRTKLHAVKLLWKGESVAARMTVQTYPSGNWLSVGQAPADGKPNLGGRPSSLSVARTLDVTLRQGETLSIPDVAPGDGTLRIVPIKSKRTMLWNLFGDERDERLEHDPAQVGSVEFKITGAVEADALDSPLGFMLSRMMPRSGFGLGSAFYNPTDPYRLEFDPKAESYRVSNLQPGSYHVMLLPEGGTSSPPVTFTITAGQTEKIELPLPKPARSERQKGAVDSADVSVSKSTRDGRGSPDSALDPTASLPNSDEETNPPNSANGDLRPNPATRSEDPSSASLRREKLKPERFAATLPSGAEIELAGLAFVNVTYADGTRRRKEDAWWRPDGTKLDAPPYKPYKFWLHEAHADFREFAIRLTPSRKDSPIAVTQIAASPLPLRGNYGGGGWDLDDPGLNFMKFEYTAGFKDEKPVALHVFVSDQPFGPAWQIDLNGKTLPSEDVDATTQALRRLISIGRVERTALEPKVDYQTVLRLELPPDHTQQMDFQIVAVSKQGQSLLPNGRLSGFGGDGVTFKSPADDLSHFEIKLRPTTHKVTFENVSLVPGRASDVTVKVETVHLLALSGLDFLKPYPKLHGLSLDMTEPQFLEIVKQQELKTRKTVEGEKVTHHIALGDDHTLIVMFDKDAKCSGIQRVRGEDDVSTRSQAEVGNESFDEQAARRELAAKDADLKKLMTDVAKAHAGGGDTSQLDNNIAMARVRVAKLQSALAEASNRRDPGSISDEQLQKLKRETLVRWGSSQKGVQVGVERVALKDSFEVGEPVVFQHRVRNTKAEEQRITLRYVASDKVSSVLHSANRFVVNSLGPVTKSFTITLAPGADTIVEGATFQIETKGMIPDRFHVESYLRFVLNDAEKASDQIDVRPPSWTQMPSDLDLTFDVVAPHSNGSVLPQPFVLQGGPDIFWGSPLQGLQAGLRYKRALKHPQQLQHSDNWIWKMDDTVQAEFIVRNVLPTPNSITYQLTEDDKLVELDPSAGSLTAYDNYSAIQPWRNKTRVARTEGHAPANRERTKILEPGEMLVIATQEFQLLQRPAANDKDWSKLPKVNCFLVEDGGLYRLKTRMGVRGTIVTPISLETGNARLWLRDANPQPEVIRATANASNVGAGQGRLTLRYNIPGAASQASIVIKPLDGKNETLRRTIKNGAQPDDVSLAPGRYTVAREMTLKVGQQQAVIECQRQVVEVAVGKVTTAEFSPSGDKRVAPKGQWNMLREHTVAGGFLTVHPVAKGQMDTANPDTYIDYEAVRETITATTCGPDGVFQIEPLPEGRYVLILRAFRESANDPQSVSLPYVVGAETFNVYAHAGEAHFYPNDFRLHRRWNMPLWRPTKVMEVTSAQNEKVSGGPNEIRTLRKPALLLPDHWIVQAVGFDTDDKELITASIQSFITIRRWDIVGKKLISEIKLQADKYGRAAREGTFMFSGDRRRLVAATDEYVGIWETATGKLLKQLPFKTKEGIYDCVIDMLDCTPDLSVIVGHRALPGRLTRSYDANVFVWDGVTGNVLRTVIDKGATDLKAIDLSMDGKRLVTTNSSGAKIWETSTGQLLRSIPNDNAGRKDFDPVYSNLVWSVQFSPDGKQVAIGDIMGMKLLDTTSGKLLQQLEGPYRFSSGGRPGLVFSKDGQWLARLGTKYTHEGEHHGYVVPIWSTRTGEKLFELHTQANDAAFSDDGQRLAVVFSDMQQALSVWSLSGDAADPEKPDGPGPEPRQDKVEENGHYRGKKSAEFIDKFKPTWGDTKLGVQYGIALTKPQRQFSSGERVPLVVFFRNASDKPLKIETSLDLFWNTPKVLNAKGEMIELEKLALFGSIPRYIEYLEPGEALGPFYLNFGLGENPRPGKQNWHPYYKTPVAGKYMLTHTVPIDVAGVKEGDPTKGGDITTGTIEFEIVVAESTAGSRPSTPNEGSDKPSSTLRSNPAAGSGDPRRAQVIAPNGEIVGRLIDTATVKPVEGATIACGAIINDSLKGGGANAITDAEGHYRLPVPSPGIYKVWLKKIDTDSSMTAAVDDGLVVEAGKVTTSQLLLAKLRKLTGKVVDADGKPCADLSVSCNSVAWPQAGNIQSVKSNGDGSFEFVLPPGRAFFNVYESVAKTENNPYGLGRHASAHVIVSATEVTAPITLTLGKLSQKLRESKYGDPRWLRRSTPGTQIVSHEHEDDVTGTVVDVAGKPIAGAKVIPVTGPINVTDDKGAFKIRIEKGTEFVMHAFAPGYHVWFGIPTAGDVLKIVLEKKPIAKPIANAARPAAPIIQSVDVRLVGGPKKEALPKVKVEFTSGHGSERMSFGKFTTDDAGWLTATLPVGFYYLHLSSEKEWPYLTFENFWGENGQGQSQSLNVRVTDQGVEKWLGGERREKGFEAATNERSARITFMLEPAVELVLRAIDVATGKGLAGVEFYEEVAAAEDWAHSVYGLNLGTKLGTKIVNNRKELTGPGNLTDKDGYLRRWIGEQSDQTKYGVTSQPPEYELVEPKAEVAIITRLGQARAEQVFKFRRIQQVRGEDIDNEVDDNGNRVPKDGKITAETNFLIVGEIPDLKSIVDPDQKLVAERIHQHFAAMQTEASDHGVRVVKLNDFLSFGSNKRAANRENPEYVLKAGNRLQPQERDERASAKPLGKKGGGAFVVPDETIRWVKQLAAAELQQRGDLKRRRPKGLEDLNTPDAIERVFQQTMQVLAKDSSSGNGHARLRYLGDTVFESLVKTAKSDDPNAAVWSCWALEHCGAKAVSPLSEILKDSPHEAVRSAAATALGQTFQPAGAPALIQALDDRPSVRHSVIFALLYLQDQRAVEPLKKHLDDKNLGHLVADALMHIAEHQGYAYWPPELLDVWQLCEDAQTLKGESFGAVEWDRLAAQVGSENHTVAGAVQLALGHLDVRSKVPAIIAAKTGYRFHVLAQLATPEAVDFLVTSLSSREQNQRKTVLSELAQGAGRWAAPLLTALLDDDSLRVAARREKNFGEGEVEWPESHQAHSALYQYFYRFGLPGEMRNLYANETNNVPEEIVRLRAWWKTHGLDFVAGKPVPNPKLTTVWYYDP